MTIKKQILSIIISIFIPYFINGCSSTKSVINPEITNITSSSVTINWLSKEPYGGEIFYHPVGKKQKPMVVKEKFKHSYKHEVQIDGLGTGKQYIYWINKPEKKYFFKTKPDETKAFSFLIELDLLSKGLSSFLMSEMPEFVLTFSQQQYNRNDYYKSIKPYIPVYNLNGQKSNYLKEERTEFKPWRLDWGGLTLLFIENTVQLNKFLDSPKAHTIVIIFQNMKNFSKPAITKSILHKILTQHNKVFPSNKIAFVLTPGSKIKKIEASKINYIQIPLVESNSEKKDKAIRIDVNIETSYAVLLNTKKEIILKSATLKKQRTCTECRRLASIGSYRESVAAYRDFINHNQGHYQIDDAFYSIAEIMDTKLFKFKEAIKWYKDLLAKYPFSTLAPLAKQRLTYILKYSDHNFEPLGQFEKIRRVDYIQIRNNPVDKEKILIKANKIIEKYKNSAIIPVIYYWLANQYRDINIQKAKDNYLALAKKYPSHEYSKGIWWEIGETYYRSAKYDEAIKAFNKALQTMPSSKEEIQAQIHRSKRNLRRTYLSLISLLLVITIALLSILLKPVGIENKKLMPGIISFIILLIIFLFASWLVMEQFASKTQLLITTTGITAAFTLGFPFSYVLSDKILRITRFKSDKFSTGLGILINLIFALSIFYLTIFYTNEHLLIIFKL